MKGLRTVVVALAGMVCLTLCALKGVKGDDLSHVQWGLAAMVMAVAGKAVGDAAAAGPGLKGVASVVLTDRRPGEPAQNGGAP